MPLANKEKVKLYMKAWRARHPGYSKEWRAKHSDKAHKEKWKAYNRNWAREHPKRHKEYYGKNKESILAKRKEERQALKEQVFSYYNNGVLACKKCGETRLACLSLDHIDGGGTKHRRQIGYRGSAFYYWLKRNNYPEGYQVLCMNCQWVKRHDNQETK